MSSFAVVAVLDGRGQRRFHELPLRFPSFRKAKDAEAVLRNLFKRQQLPAWLFNVVASRDPSNLPTDDFLSDDILRFFWEFMSSAQREAQAAENVRPPSSLPSQGDGPPPLIPIDRPDSPPGLVDMTDTDDTSDTDEDMPSLMSARECDSYDGPPSLVSASDTDSD